MQFVLAFLLILSIVSHQQSHAEVTNGACRIKQCEPGYFWNKTGAKCDSCENGTFTAIKNCIPKCLPCSVCKSYQITLSPCSLNRSVVCGCKENLYFSKKTNDCEKCSCDDCIIAAKNPDYIQKCQPCKRKECQEKPECRKICPPVTTPVSPNPSTTTSTVTRKPAASSTRPAAASNRTSNPSVTKLPPQSGNQMSWVFLAVVGVLFLLLFWLMLLYTRNLLTYSDVCWSKGKDVELPEANEQRHHRGPTTLSWEEAPMIPVSQIPPRSDPGSSPVGPPPPPGDDLPVSRPEDQPDRWPAVVLYAIIQEVPLRRWKEFLRRLSVADQQLERVELEAGLGLDSMERQYQMLKLWSQRSTASIGDVFSALRHMDLSGCAQLLQEHLDGLPWRPDAKQSDPGGGLNGTMHT